MERARRSGLKPERHGLVAALKMAVRRHFWIMDIHRSAIIAKSAYIDRTWPRGIHIGEDTIIGEEAVVLTHDMTRGIYRDTSIGSRCYIGPRAIILPGIRVGDDAVVRAGAVVTKDVSPGSCVEGNPARQVATDTVGDVT